MVVIEKNRKSAISRKTTETDIQLELNLDGAGQHLIDTGVPFLNHMLTLFSVHGFLDLSLRAEGDIDIDDHHTTEDIGIVLGQAIAQALGNKGGISRYASVYLPMDEALVRIVIDLSNRPYLHYNAPVIEQKLGTFDSCLVKEFFRAVSQQAGMTLHIDMIHGENGHHIVEAIFKGFGRALSLAIEPLGTDGALSSKGCL
ncbi:imidazoleglycerol-phosphate dehydratase HisB [Desulfotalea psychrophila]|uniref:Imidazoleglycerol-phosphate dehydratase n=1 Tax=Desulfotalea psychrophila (strain LSv54 / DSM 12343) TaxID=177439 RepID=HIS7_DESPS|nr:imidazoleglycerol-phosphate dehydratase HisB [Desulfotalea psychrophila]Q6ANL7.1 RecName: Full=Imidazoleglycerol-phosphate dehydratase; Short=IGPD [Desulfotalea psychrophila LSv54]CAG36057.1 probable imidazoleglycerol-phosphate dehydratase [Desulfotalea psychrophila LSv54]